MFCMLPSIMLAKQIGDKSNRVVLLSAPDFCIFVITSSNTPLLLFTVGIIMADSVESVLHLPSCLLRAFLIPSNQACHGHA